MTRNTETERKSKQFWAIDDFWNVLLVTGYECPPNDGIWWVPELGYSMDEKHHLFKSAKEARAMAITKLESNIEDLRSALTRLRIEESQS